MLCRRLVCLGLIKRQLFTNVDPKQIDKFSSVELWERRRQALKPFVANRVKFIHKAMVDSFKENINNVSILDLGCGVGFIAEEIARLGLKVHGIDPGESLIQYAKKSLQRGKQLSDNLTYDTGTSKEELTKKGNEVYDVIICSQVLEHVPDYKTIVGDIALLLKKNGLAIISTDNRRLRTWLQLCVLDELIRRKRPIGTHKWHRLIKPEELKKVCKDNGLITKKFEGWNMAFFKDEWKENNKGTSYMIAAVKE